MKGKKNTWLWVAGAVVVAGGTYWYVSRKSAAKKKEEEEEGKKLPKRPSNLHVVETRSEAERLMLEPVTGKLLTVWMRNGGTETEVIDFMRTLAKDHPDIQFYFFYEDTLGHLIGADTGVIVGAAEDGLRKARSIYGLDTKVVNAQTGINRAIDALEGLGAGVPGAVENFGDVLSLPIELTTFLPEALPPPGILP
jgi:hypothetical protein